MSFSASSALVALKYLNLSNGEENLDMQIIKDQLYKAHIDVLVNRVTATSLPFQIENIRPT